MKVEVSNLAAGNPYRWKLYGFTRSSYAAGSSYTIGAAGASTTQHGGTSKCCESFTVDNPEEKVESLGRTYADGHIERLDGISVSYDDWHFNVRPSNTEPLLRLNLEALDPTTMAMKRDEILAHLRS